MNVQMQHHHRIIVTFMHNTDHFLLSDQLYHNCVSTVCAHEALRMFSACKVCFLISATPRLSCLDSVV